MLAGDGAVAPLAGGDGSGAELAVGLAIAEVDFLDFGTDLFAGDAEFGAEDLEEGGIDQGHSVEAVFEFIDAAIGFGGGAGGGGFGAGCAAFEAGDLRLLEEVPKHAWLLFGGVFWWYAGGVALLPAALGAAGVLNLIGFDFETKRIEAVAEEGAASAELSRNSYLWRVAWKCTWGDLAGCHAAGIYCRPRRCVGAESGATCRR